MTQNDYASKIARELGIRPGQVSATVQLLDDDSTVPFIARYRKEATGTLDEVQITAVRDRVTELRELDKRRETVLKTIHKQGKLSKELEAKIMACETMAVLEDLYLPYKPKKRTKGMVAKEKGLEPLAKVIFAQDGVDPAEAAKKFVNAEKKVVSVDAALAGARDIIAEWINENSDVRAEMRALFQDKGVIFSKVINGKEDDGRNYKDYFDWNESVRTIPSHRILAVRRGEKEKFLSVKITVPEEDALKILREHFLKSRGPDGSQVEMAIEDSFKRLLSMSMETETRLELKKRADADAIEIFKNNLRELLMAPPMGQRPVIAIDPGVRTGSKLVCLDAQGKLLESYTVYIHQTERQREQAREIIRACAEKFQPEIIAIGNGTGSKETEEVVRGVDLPEGVKVMLVSETGASVYSASEAAREEFPDQDVTVRGSVSIGRRIMDPLAEFVKIDPKAIGIGQYQHDVDQRHLRRSLDDVVESCVNLVGVELNTASRQLLSYVSGLGPKRALQIIEHRNASGPFRSREELREISGLGGKAFEQCAGFLRIRDGIHPLDGSAVHPEAYGIVDQMAKDLGCSIDDLLKKPDARKKIDVHKYVTESIGLPTLMDIKNELAKPGRDPRPPFEIFTYAEGVDTIDDLTPGLKLPGVITNITAFGAFVDIGVHHDGLIHISQISDKFVKDPHAILKVHQKVEVTVMEIDKARGRIACSLLKNPKR